jgi:hypothetical protein
MKTESRIPIGVCVPTIREEQISTFLARWTPHWSAAAQDAYEVKLFIHEDHPSESFRLKKPVGVELVHTCQADIGEALGASEWIIPRGTGACRSFPMYLAWKRGCEYILTLDDDCYPLDGEGGSFLATHLAAFSQDRWFRTISGEDPRGVPYGDRGLLPVLLNHGLWAGAPDLDGPTALVHLRRAHPITLRAAREVVPPGMWFTLCAMNVCYHRRAIPAAYNLLMGLETAGFDRFDDIWSGLLLKRVADHLGWYVTNGAPFVLHAKASDPFVNLRKEARGIQVHEFFWRHVAAAVLPEAVTVADCYRCLADWVGRLPTEMPAVGAPPSYFERLCEAMLCWLALFE